MIGLGSDNYLIYQLSMNIDILTHYPATIVVSKVRENELRAKTRMRIGQPAEKYCTKNSMRTLEATVLRRAYGSYFYQIFNTMPVGVDSHVKFFNEYDFAACREKNISW